MNTPVRNRAAWLRNNSGFGLMFHYIDKPASSNVISTTSSVEWNRRVDSFGVGRFARRVRETGASWILFTLGQNTGHYCSPNAAYDEITGLRGNASRLSRRDLVAEIADALAPDGIKLIAYLPSHAPANHPEAVRALRCMPPWDAGKWGLKRFWPDSKIADERLTGMQRNWETVTAHWGERWGDAVAGWWIDGCYFADRMYRGADEPNFSSFARALRAGNPDRILAFNSGTATPFERLAVDQDYTAGEFSNRLPADDKWTPLFSTTDGMQTHLLGFLGNHWGAGEPRFPDAFVTGYTRYLTQRGVALTWDIPIAPDGDIPSAFLRQIETITSHV
ncbi:hypothetical protein OpiT1DRAFT_00152 [Opitutaceae bacterium TAV1]|nr:hypothetical protein OpiT1DRAFT_00152 [Opitutaceae bacterium TAV1]